MQIEEPRSYKTSTGEPEQDEGSRALPIVTQRGLHRCMNFRVALVHKALVSASKVCHEGYRIILDSEPGQSSHEVGVEGEEANLARGLPSPTQPTRKEIQDGKVTCWSVEFCVILNCFYQVCERC